MDLVGRRDEDEARAMVAATVSKLRDVSEEADMHRQKAASLERALEAVLKECDELAAAVAAGGPPARAESEAEAGAGAGAQDVSRAGESVDLSESGTALEDDGEEGVHEEEEEAAAKDDESGDVGQNQAGSSSAATDAAAAPSLLLGVDDAADPADAVGTPSLLLGVDDPPQPADLPHGEQAGGPGDKEHLPAASAPSLLVGVDDPPQQPTPPPGVIVGGSEQGGSQEVEPSLLEFEDGGGGGDETFPTVAANGNVDSGDGDGEGDDGGSDASEDSEGAAVEKLTAWLMGLKIRRTDAARYARSLVDDGFDSGEVSVEALECQHQHRAVWHLTVDGSLLRASRAAGELTA